MLWTLGCFGRWRLCPDSVKVQLARADSGDHSLRMSRHGVGLDFSTCEQDLNGVGRQ